MTNLGELLGGGDHCATILCGGTDPSLLFAGPGGSPISKKPLTCIEYVFPQFRRTRFRIPCARFAPTCSTPVCRSSTHTPHTLHPLYAHGVICFHLPPVTLTYRAAFRSNRLHPQPVRAPSASVCAAKRSGSLCEECRRDWQVGMWAHTPSHCPLDHSLPVEGLLPRQ